MLILITISVDFFFQCFVGVISLRNTRNMIRDIPVHDAAAPLARRAICWRITGTSAGRSPGSSVPIAGRKTGSPPTPTGTSECAIKAAKSRHIDYIKSWTLHNVRAQCLAREINAFLSKEICQWNELSASIYAYLRVVQRCEVAVLQRSVRSQQGRNLIYLFHHISLAYGVFCWIENATHGITIIRSLILSPFFLRTFISGRSFIRSFIRFGESACLTYRFFTFCPRDDNHEDTSYKGSLLVVFIYSSLSLVMFLVSVLFRSGPIALTRPAFRPTNRSSPSSCL